jgi:molybdenum cofactor cytidylyltransferase
MITTNRFVPKLKVVVLAAGFSTRLGQPKALARLRGVSLLRRTLMLACALPAAGVIVIVPPACTRYRREARDLPVTCVRNAQRRLGLSSSVRCGLMHSKYASAALLLPVDLAQLKLGELNRLVSHWRARPSRVVATRLSKSMAEHAGDDAKHSGAAAETAGTPLILPARMFARALSIKGDVGLRAMVAGLPAAQRLLVDLPSAQSDVDTVRDLAMARRRWN